MSDKKVQEYKGKDYTVTYDKEVCVHAAVCVKSLPKVFNPKARPWVNTEGATKQEIQDTVKNCPSGALKFLSKS